MSGGRIGLLGVALCLLSSCAVGPDYQTPQVQTGGDQFANAGQPEFVNKEVDLLWWRQFRDPTLDRLIDETLRANWDLKGAEANLREARALYLQSGLDLFPTVVGRATYNE